MSEELPVTSTNTVTYIFSHGEWDWSEDRFENELNASLDDLQDIDLEVLSVSTAYDDRENPVIWPNTFHRMASERPVFVQFGGTDEQVEHELGNIKDSISSEDLEVLVTGTWD